jgi:hypothetical protein
MKYHFDSVAEIPHEQRKWIMEQRKYVDGLVEAKKRRTLMNLEDKWLEQWNYYKNHIDELDKIRKPNIREEILISRFEFTKYHKLLEYIHEKSPYKRVKMKETVG